ncbi:nucleotidyltransferase domain-containing protein [Selenomonas sp.]|uniref:nucleotidyltransferase domain-containing protein n=1 Tax=Selenomonas sp. TaxID=2053611 RepID=UPI003FA243C9
MEQQGKVMQMKTMAEPQIRWTVREEKIFTQLRDLAKRYDVGKLVLFGSRARRLQAEKSDVDIAVYDCADFRDFAFDVEEKVDTLLTFDIVNMNESPSAELVAEILRDGVILYEKVQEPLINSATPSWRIFPTSLRRQILRIAPLCVRFVSLIGRKICTNLTNFILSVIPMTNFPVICMYWRRLRCRIWRMSSSSAASSTSFSFSLNLAGRC